MPTSARAASAAFRGGYGGLIWPFIPPHPKAPLCKGGWHGVSRDWGIVNPSVMACAMTAPLTQGSLGPLRFTGAL